MTQIVDLDELVPEDITFSYRKQDYTIPGDLKTGDTLNLYALLIRLANAEAKGSASELKRIISQCETALLPIFQIHHPEMETLPFGAAGLGVVLRKVLELIGLLEVGPAADPPLPAPPNRKQRRSTRTQTTPGSGSEKKTVPRQRPAGSRKSKSS